MVKLSLHIRRITSFFFFKKKPNPNNCERAAISTLWDLAEISKQQQFYPLQRILASQQRVVSSAENINRKNTCRGQCCNIVEMDWTFSCFRGFLAWFVLFYIKCKSQLDSWPRSAVPCGPFTDTPRTAFSPHIGIWILFRRHLRCWESSVVLESACCHLHILAHPRRNSWDKQVSMFWVMSWIPHS